jgi:hypothetical protein
MLEHIDSRHVTRGLDPRVHHLRKTEGVFRKRMDWSPG